MPENTPQAVVDAGGEEWPRVEVLLERYARELAGGVLEIHTRHPEVPEAIGAWCARWGHTVLAAHAVKGVTGLHIRLSSTWRRHAFPG
ncbi:hypothetical protein AB0D57_42790 [Streptomyces sp. NPDC048275]|uniref:sulfurtransferase TusA family protein n=1 Tax=Streptomyces sp. NPDC048275 TaxID=3155629 RepID=UPI0033ED6CC3